MSIQTVGIVGAGTMGNGIAQACAVSGVNVVMVDISEAAVAKGLATVAGSLDRLIKKEKISEADKAAALSRIKGSTQYEDLKGTQLVIEAATENEQIKVKILQQLDQLLAPETIIASNTSSISITKLAATTGRADRFIGMHFFNPVPMMALVKSVRDSPLEDIRVPTLVIHSPKDSVVSPARIEAAYARLGTPAKRIVKVEDSEDRAHHVLAGDILAPSGTAALLAPMLDFVRGAAPQAQPPGGNGLSAVR